MLALIFTVMLASSALNDPGIGSPGLDNRTPEIAQSTAEIGGAPQTADLPLGQTEAGAALLARGRAQ